MLFCFCEILDDTIIVVKCTQYKKIFHTLIICLKKTGFEIRNVRNGGEQGFCFMTLR